MNFTFSEIEKRKSISKKDFKKEFYNFQKPVVIHELTNDWHAKEKWNFDYIKKMAGNIIVPLYDNKPVAAEDGFNEPRARMLFKDYIELLEREPTDLRIFLFNLIKEVPTLQDDFKFPDLGLRLLKSLPMMFFGGMNSKVFMHYDIDLANILHFQFQGKKECILVPPNQSSDMYQVPFSVISREDIDFDNPDFNKFPDLRNLKPYKVTLYHGDMLYIPEGYWHYMKYITPGFSMSLRSIPHKPTHLLEALNNVFVMRHFDGLMRKFFGQKWIDYKNKKALNS